MSDSCDTPITLAMMRQSLYSAVVCDALDALGYPRQSPRLAFTPYTSDQVLVGHCKTTLWGEMAHEDSRPYEKELLAIIHALKIWHIYLEGQHFKVITDHKSLIYFNTQPTLSRRQARWNELLQEYDFEIIYKQGKTNVVADVLSRHADLKLNSIVQIIPDQQILEAIKKEYSEDADFGEVYKTLPSRNKTVLVHL